MLIGWLSAESLDRRNADRKHVEVVIRRVLQRAEQAWAKRFDGLQRVLAKAVVRIRWLNHGNEIVYGKRGLLHVIRARVFLGLLEQRMRYYLRALRCGVGKQLTRKQAQALRRVIRTWCWRGCCEIGYYVLLCMLVRSCKRGQFEWHLNPSLFTEAEGWTLCSARDVRFQLQEALRFWKTIPIELKNAPVHKQVCWQCERPFQRKLLCCAGCTTARYCGQDCYAEAWPVHKRVCKRLNGLVNKTLAQQALEEAGEATTWGELIYRCLFCGQSMHQNELATFSSAPEVFVICFFQVLALRQM